MTLASTVVAWVTLPQTEAYYGNGSNGTAVAYPQNAQGMVEHALRVKLARRLGLSSDMAWNGILRERATEVTPWMWLDYGWVLITHRYIARTDRLCAYHALYDRKLELGEIARWEHHRDAFGPCWLLWTKANADSKLRFGPSPDDDVTIGALADIGPDQPLEALAACLVEVTDD